MPRSMRGYIEAEVLIYLTFAGTNLEQLTSVVKREFVVMFACAVDDHPVGLRESAECIFDTGG